MSSRLVIETTKRTVVYLESPPTKPSYGQFTFTSKGSVMTGTFSGVNPPAPTENVTSQTVKITVAGTEIGSFDLVANPSIDFPCNANDLCRAVVTFGNASGTTDGDPIEATATAGTGGGGAPSKPTGGTFSFRA